MEITAYVMIAIVAYLIGNYMGFRTALTGGTSIAKYTVAEMKQEIHEIKKMIHDD